RVGSRHPLVRSGVYGSAGFAQRERAHRSLAYVLTGERDADRRAWHLAAATVGPDDAVAAELEETAERARARGGYDAAAAALARAADLTTKREEQGRRLVRAAQAAALAGRSRHAMSIADRGGRLVEDPLLRADVELVRGTAELTSGRADAASDILAAASQSVREHDEIRAVQLAGQALEAAGASGDQARLARAIEAGRGVDPRDERDRALRAQ